VDTCRSFARGRFAPRDNPSAAAGVGLASRVGTLSLVVLLLASPVARAMQSECMSTCGWADEACMAKCAQEEAQQSDIPQARAFGVIAVSAQNYWAGSDYPDREQAEADAMAACHAKASNPEGCRIQAVYEWPQCGAVARGDNGQLAVRTAQNQAQAENAAMAACRRIPGNAGCAVQAHCAMSPEARARSKAIRKNVVGWMGGALRELWNLPPEVVDEPLVGPEDPRAQYELGLAHHRGNGASQDFRLAARWYQKAVAQGYAPAQLNLGVMYQMGQGVQQDLAKAADLYEKAAMQGEVEAQFNLGMMYHQGLGVPLDHAQAAAWYRMAAAQGHQQAKEMLELLAEGER
jgi:hypothetical protein